MKDILPVHHSLTVSHQQKNFTTRNEEYISTYGNVITENDVNADVNDSYQIMRKVYPQLFDNRC